MSDWNQFSNFFQKSAFGGNKKDQVEFVRGFTRGKGPNLPNIGLPELFKKRKPLDDYYIDKEGIVHEVGYLDGEWFDVYGRRIEDKELIQEIEEGNKRFIEEYTRGKQQGEYFSAVDAYQKINKKVSRSQDLKTETLLSSNQNKNSTEQPILSWQPSKTREFLPDVQLAQTLLLKSGVDVGPDGADGYFGDNTLKAVKEFQRKKGLKITGKIDPATWNALAEYANE